MSIHAPLGTVLECLREAVPCFEDVSLLIAKYELISTPIVCYTLLSAQQYTTDTLGSQTHIPYNFMGFVTLMLVT